MFYLIFLPSFAALLKMSSFLNSFDRIFNRKTSITFLEFVYLVSTNSPNWIIKSHLLKDFAQIYASIVFELRFHAFNQKSCELFVTLLEKRKEKSSIFLCFLSAQYEVADPSIRQSSVDRNFVSSFSETTNIYQRASRKSTIHQICHDFIFI